MKIKALSLVLFVLFSLSVSSQAEEPVEVIMFVSAHCRSCQRAKESIIPRIKEKYGDRIKVEELDYTEPENYLRLMNLQDKYNWHPAEFLTPTIFIDGRFLVGLEEMNKYLEVIIDSALSREGYVPGTSTGSTLDWISRFRLITPLVVITAGLIDGINPCAFTVIIFFISFLALQGYSRRQVIAIGLTFILAVFVIYVLIGLGLFNFLFKLKAYWLIVKIIYIAGAVLCFILAGLAFYDFVKFRRTHQTQSLILQLPPGFKERIQRIIGLYYRKGGFESERDKKNHILRLIFSSFIVGCLVSLFEAVCTGQVYLPTIVFVLKSIPLKLKAFSYLLIYNLMFILPLWLILLFALLGVTSQQFGRFAQKHIGTIKILMMVLFLGFGFLLIWK